jgi:hypothetical protein
MHGLLNPGEGALGNNRIRGWVDFIAGLDAVE